MSRAPASVDVATARFEAACCGDCGHLFLPPGPVCPRCWSDRLDRRQLSGDGEVATFTVYRQQYHPDFPPPYVLALIALREGPRLVSNVVDCAPEAVRIGMPVRLRWQRRGERVLPLFTPAPPAAGTTSTDPGAEP